MTDGKRIFDSVDLSAKRRDGESFAQYKKRQRDNHHLLRVYLGGRLLWRGGQGQYIKPEGGIQ